MQECKSFRRLNLQFFAEGAGASGGASSGGAEGSGTGSGGTTAESMLATSKGAKNSLANVSYGIQGDVQTANAQTDSNVSDVSPEDRNAKFEALIKGEYKDLYDARMQDTIQKRLKSTKETVDRFNALSPTLEMLGKKYGVDASNIEALNKAIEEDDSYYEDEALEKGITVEQLKSIRKMERENEDLKRQMNERQTKENADRIYAGWMEQSNSVKSVYPSFNLQTELQNPQFTNLLRNNVDVRTAYEVIHKDEIIPAAMQFTANQVRQKVANSVIANGNRPNESGVGTSSAIVKSDVSQLTKADRQEIARRVARGEKIRF